MEENGGLMGWRGLFDEGEDLSHRLRILSQFCTFNCFARSPLPLLPSLPGSYEVAKTKVANKNNS